MTFYYGTRTFITLTAQVLYWSLQQEQVCLSSYASNLYSEGSAFMS